MFFCEIYEFFTGEAATGGVFVKKAVLKIFAIFKGKLQSCNFI